MGEAANTTGAKYFQTRPNWTVVHRQSDMTHAQRGKEQPTGAQHSHQPSTGQRKKANSCPANGQQSHDALRHLLTEQTRRGLTFILCNFHIVYPHAASALLCDFFFFCKN